MPKCFMIRPFIYVTNSTDISQAHMEKLCKIAHVHRWQDSSKLSVNLQQFEYASYLEL